jgi:hypothetical protein
MDIGAATPAAVLDRLAAAWTEAVQADAAGGAGAQGAAPAGQGLSSPRTPAETLRGPDATADAAPPSTATPPDAADAGPKTGSAQTLGWSLAQPAVPWRTADTVLPGTIQAGSESALPAEQLVQVALTALRVDGAAAWALLNRAPGGPWMSPPATPRTVTAHERNRSPRDDDPPQDDDSGSGGKPSRDDLRDGPVGDPVLDDAAARDWLPPLMAALRRALSGRPPPPALLAAAGQWHRGRCIVLACPQGAEPGAPAWAFVLWPGRARPGTRASGLRGLRVPARLQWTLPPRPRAWWHGRAIKEHHPRRGRQLVALDPGTGAVPCEVQLGPVRAQAARPCQVALRIDAVRRFWAALGTQWSVLVLVSSRALLDADATTTSEAP